MTAEYETLGDRIRARREQRLTARITPPEGISEQLAALSERIDKLIADNNLKT